MALPALATISDLKDRDLPVTERSTVDLAAASAAVRSAAGSAISPTVATVRLLGTSGAWLRLTGRVASVTAVTVDGVTVTDFTTWPHGLYRPDGWGTASSEVTVSATVGGPVDDDIIALVCDLATMAGAQAGPDDHRVVSESLDDYQVRWADGAPVSVFELPKATRDALRARFGSSTAVVGSL